MANQYWHVWFSLKRRAPALEEELAGEVLALIKEVAREAEVRLLAAQAAVDHLHLLLGLPGGTRLPRAMQRLKGDDGTADVHPLSRVARGSGPSVLLAEVLRAQACASGRNRWSEEVH